jgi:hypothetical protein
MRNGKRWLPIIVFINKPSFIYCLQDMLFLITYVIRNQRLLHVLK